MPQSLCPCLSSEEFPMWKRVLAHALCRSLEVGVAVGVLGLAQFIGGSMI